MPFWRAISIGCVGERILCYSVSGSSTSYVDSRIKTGLFDQKVQNWGAELAVHRDTFSILGRVGGVGARGSQTRDLKRSGVRRSTSFFVTLYSASRLSLWQVRQPLEHVILILYERAGNAAKYALASSRRPLVTLPSASHLQTEQRTTPVTVYVCLKLQR